MKYKNSMPPGKYEVRLHWIGPDGAQEMFSEHTILVPETFDLIYEADDLEILADTGDVVTRSQGPFNLDLHLQGRLISNDGTQRLGSITRVNHGVVPNER